jgi:anoctamin-10
MALINNVPEFPSDAFKIVTHFRRPLPQRTDTIGPWLDCLSFLAWLSALTNSALVYLFRPSAETTAAGMASLSTLGKGRVEIERARMQEVLARALFIALAASHGYILLRAAVRHVLEHALWYGSAEKKRLDAASREVKERYLQSVGGAAALSVVAGASISASSSTYMGATTEDKAAAASPDAMTPVTPPLLSPLPPSQPAMPPPGEFWQFDEGLDEIRKGIKEA